MHHVLYHFGSREQYLKALASYVAIEFDRTLAAANRVSGLVAVLEITRAVLGQREVDPTPALATQIVLADPQRERALSDDIASLRDETLALLSRHIQSGIQTGEIRSDVAPEFASLLIAAGICGIIDTWLATLQFDIKTAGDQLLAMIEHGLRRG